MERLPLPIRVLPLSEVKWNGPHWNHTNGLGLPERREIVSSFFSGGNRRETEFLSNKAREGSSGKWLLGGVNKNTGTDLEMSERSQQEPTVSAGPKGS